MQLVLVRHGQSVNNASYTAAMAQWRSEAPEEAQITEEIVARWERVPDPPLTELGVSQAEALGEALKAGELPFVPTHLYASPTLRAVATARPLSEASELPMMLQPDAYEVGGIQRADPETGERSALAGATLAELQEVGGLVEAPPGLFAAEGEPWHGGFEPNADGALSRAGRLLSALLTEHRQEDVAVLVCHQFFAQFILMAAMGWNVFPGRGFRIDNTGHVSMRLEEGGAEVEWVNRLEHLGLGDVTN